jgi:hypothetical protein
MKSVFLTVPLLFFHFFFFSKNRFYVCRRSSHSSTGSSGSTGSDGQSAIATSHLGDSLHPGEA